MTNPYPPGLGVVTPESQTYGYPRERKYYVADYTAKFNNTADDTNAIQAAINDCGTNGGGWVIMPAGQTNISATLTMLSPNVKLLGGGVDATILTMTTNNIDGIRIGNSQVTPFTQLNGMALKDFTISLPTNSTGSCVNITGMGVGGYIDNVKTGQGTLGFLLEDIDRSSFRGLQAFNYAGAGIVCRQGHANTWGTVSFLNCAAVSNTANTNCFQFDADAGQGSPNKFDRVSFINCHMFANPGTAGTVGASFSVGAQCMAFINCLWENTIQHVVSTAETDISFNGCSFLNTNFGSTPTTNIFSMGAFMLLSVYDCSFQQATNVFNGTAGFPNVGVFGQNKNNGNLAHIFAGSFGHRYGTDVAFVGASNFFIGATFMAVTTQTTTYNVGANDGLILGNATGAAFTVTLPNANAQTGVRYIVKKIDASANAVTVATGGGNIDGAATKVLSTQYASVDVVSDGSNWWIV